MSKNIMQALPELVAAGVLPPETAEQIRDYYRRREPARPKALFIAFGILGALSVGLGLLLLLAHNWDDLPRATKTSLAFAPLVLGQLLCFYALGRQAANAGWRESAAAFLFLAVGASIALVSQIYHIPGQGGTFLFTWMLLGLPLVYLLRSSMVSLLYVLGITYYAFDTAESGSAPLQAWTYWLLLLGVMPHYYLLIREKPASSFTFSHHWLLPVSAALALVTVEENASSFLWPAYASLFGGYRLLGASPLFQEQKRRNNGYLLVGTLGTLALLLALSFGSFWRNMVLETLSFPQVMRAPEFIAAASLSLLALALLAARYRRQPKASLQAEETAFLLVILAFMGAFFHPVIPVVLVNGLVAAIGLLAIRRGARTGQLGRLNYGLLVVAALIACRFFDGHLPFVLRGLLFVLLGLGFFFTNYWMHHKSKTHD
jgi:uncharacterized membrane protein